MNVGDKDKVNFEEDNIKIEIKGIKSLLNSLEE